MSEDAMTQAEIEDTARRIWDSFTEGEEAEFTRSSYAQRVNLMWQRYPALREDNPGFDALYHAVCRLAGDFSD